MTKLENALAQLAYARTLILRMHTSTAQPARHALTRDAAHARRRNAIVEYSSPVLWPGLGKIGQAGDIWDRDARARPGELGGAGRGARGAVQRPPAPLPTLYLVVADSVSDGLISAASIIGSLCLTASVFGSLCLWQPLILAASFECISFAALFGDLSFAACLFLPHFFLPLSLALSDW